MRWVGWEVTRGWRISMGRMHGRFVVYRGAAAAVGTTGVSSAPSAKRGA